MLRCHCHSLTSLVTSRCWTRSHQREVCTCWKTKVFLPVSNRRAEKYKTAHPPPDCIWPPPWSRSKTSVALCNLGAIDANLWTASRLKQFWCCTQINGISYGKNYGGGEAQFPKQDGRETFESFGGKTGGLNLRYLPNLIWPLSSQLVLGHENSSNWDTSLA